MKVCCQDLNTVLLAEDIDKNQISNVETSKSDMHKNRCTVKMVW